jgi:hypothetical protein
MGKAKYQNQIPNKTIWADLLKQIKVSFQGQLHPSISGMQSHPRLWSYWQGCPDNSDIKKDLIK